VLPKREVVKPERGCSAGGIVAGLVWRFYFRFRGKAVAGLSGAWSGWLCRHDWKGLERERLPELGWSWLSGSESQKLMSCGL